MSNAIVNNTRQKLIAGGAIKVDLCREVLRAKGEKALRHLECVLARRVTIHQAKA